MARKNSKLVTCQICSNSESKYTCSACFVRYCSVACYKDHKNSSCSTVVSQAENEAAKMTLESSEIAAKDGISTLEDSDCVIDALLSSDEVKRPLRPLSSLKWPFIPDEPSYVDPFSKNDPRPLTLANYEAIATSKDIRRILLSHGRLPEILRDLDQLQGREREEELERVLGVTPDSNLLPENSIRGRRQMRQGKVAVDESDIQALKKLVEATEAAVRGDTKSAIGLDWEEEQ